MNRERKGGGGARKNVHLNLKYPPEHVSSRESPLALAYDLRSLSRHEFTIFVSTVRPQGKRPTQRRDTHRWQTMSVPLVYALCPYRSYYHHMYQLCAAYARARVHVHMYVWVDKCKYVCVCVCVCVCTDICLHRYMRSRRLSRSNDLYSELLSNFKRPRKQRAH